MSEFVVVGFVGVGIIVVEWLVWTFFIAGALSVRSHGKNAGSRVPSRARIGAVKRTNRLNDSLSGLKSPDNF